MKKEVRKIRIILAIEKTFSNAEKVYLSQVTCSISHYKLTSIHNTEIKVNTYLVLSKTVIVIYSLQTKEVNIM